RKSRDVSGTPRLGHPEARRRRAVISMDFIHFGAADYSFLVIGDVLREAVIFDTNIPVVSALLRADRGKTSGSPAYRHASSHAYRDVQHPESARPAEASRGQIRAQRGRGPLKEGAVAVRHQPRGPEEVHSGTHHPSERSDRREVQVG